MVEGKGLSGMNIDEPCSALFCYRELIACSTTLEELVPDSTQDGVEIPLRFLPQQEDTWDAIRRLAQELLDPVCKQFGRPELTYGFSSCALSNKIDRRISPKHDQHAGHELRRNGQPICERGGFAVDFVVAGTPSHQLAQWLLAHTPVDRLYFYEDDRPIHVSVGPDESRSIWWMKSIGDNRRIPVAFERYASVGAAARS
jgi:hypothetical protein